MSSKMSDANADRRRAMLDRIRTGLNQGASMKSRREAVAARLAGGPPHLIPERAKKDASGLKALLSEHLKSQLATVIDVRDMATLPTAIAQYLRSQNLPLRVRVGSDPRLAAAPWSTEPALTLDAGRAQGSDEVGLSHAVAGVAETGTLVMASGAANPVTLNYLPETHLVVLRAGDIIGHYEAAFEKIRGTLGRGVMPRTLNMISGPSRTADIGGRLVVGAHGPRRLCVLIVAE